MMKRNADQNSLIMDSISSAATIAISVSLGVITSIIIVFHISVIIWDAFYLLIGTYCAITMTVFKFPTWEQYSTKGADADRLVIVKKQTFLESSCYRIYFFSIIFTTSLLVARSVYSVASLIVIVVLTIFSFFTRRW